MKKYLFRSNLKQVFFVYIAVVLCELSLPLSGLNIDYYGFIGKKT